MAKATPPPKTESLKDWAAEKGTHRGPLCQTCHGADKFVTIIREYLDLRQKKETFRTLRDFHRFLANQGYPLGLCALSGHVKKCEGYDGQT